MARCASGSRPVLFSNVPSMSRARRRIVGAGRGGYAVQANIAEGYGRRLPRERLRFLNIAEGSLAEVAYCIHAGWRLGYIGDDVLKELEKDLNGVGAPLIGLIRSIRTRSTPAS